MCVWFFAFAAFVLAVSLVLVFVALRVTRSRSDGRVGLGPIA